MSTLASHALFDMLRHTLHDLASHWAVLRRRRQDRQILSEMGARDLRDLGLGRDQIDYLTAPTTPGRWE